MISRSLLAMGRIAGPPGSYEENHRSYRIKDSLQNNRPGARPYRRLPEAHIRRKAIHLTKLIGHLRRWRYTTNQTRRMVDRSDFTDDGWLNATQMSGRHPMRSPAYLHLKLKLEWNFVRSRG